MYYATNQKLFTSWNGVRKVGTWSLDEEGGVCWHIVGWGKQPCEYYFNGPDGSVWSRFRGFDKIAVQHVEGNQL